MRPCFKWFLTWIWNPLAQILRIKTIADLCGVSVTAMIAAIWAKVGFLGTLPWWYLLIICLPAIVLVVVIAGWVGRLMSTRPDGGLASAKWKRITSVVVAVIVISILLVGRVKFFV